MKLLRVRGRFELPRVGCSFLAAGAFHLDLYSLPDSLLWCHDKLSGMVGTATARGGTSRPRTSSIVPGRLAERVSCP